MDLQPLDLLAQGFGMKTSSLDSLIHKQTTKHPPRIDQCSDRNQASNVAWINPAIQPESAILYGRRPTDGPGIGDRGDVGERPRFRQFGDGDWGASPIPAMRGRRQGSVPYSGKLGAGTGERPRFRQVGDEDGPFKE